MQRITHQGSVNINDAPELIYLAVLFLPERMDASHEPLNLQLLTHRTDHLTRRKQFRTHSFVTLRTAISFIPMKMESSVDMVRI
jgi:hypothetical protein